MITSAIKFNEKGKEKFEEDKKHHRIIITGI